MATILLTGFEPFGGETVNPSWLIASALDGETVGGAHVHALRLPTEFRTSLRVLRAALRRHRPVLAVALGQAGGRAELSVERVAINVDDARIPDNAGARPIDVPVVRGGPAAHFSTLPIKAIVAALRERGVPAAVSQTAGTFVCNHVFYALQHALAGTRVRSGFVHVPWLPEQAGAWPGAPALPLETMVIGVREVLRVAMTHRGPDLREGGGAVD
ncbi:MAG: pyroglutamyl-peptidase I [Burkholderiales bacterium]